MNEELEAIGFTRSTAAEREWMSVCVGECVGVWVSVWVGSEWVRVSEHLVSN